MSSRGRRPAAAATLLAAAAALVLGACGKKGDPEPPLLPIPRAATDLTVEQRGGELILRFAYPNTTAAGLPLPPLERVEVHELVRPAVLPPPPPPAAEAPATPETDEPAESSDPAAERYVPPQVDPREFTAAATVVRTLRAEELAGAVYGDRLIVTLPLPSPLPEPPQAHLFAVRTAAVGDHVSAFSNRAAIVPRSPPAPPAGLNATPRADGVEIAWEPAAGAADLAGFQVYRRHATERGFGPPLRLAGPAQTSFLDRDARYGQRYIYAVTAVAQRRPLIESEIASAREVDYRDLFAPPAPAGLVALADEGAIRLVWNESRAPDLAGYRISRSGGDGPWQPLTPEPVAGVEHVDRTVEPGTAYRYRVTAVDALGNESDPAAAEALAR